MKKYRKILFRNSPKMSGFTLIELIIFITVTSVLGTSMFIAINRALSGFVDTTNITVATELAQKRMELILGERYNMGFINFFDPCNSENVPPICTSPPGFIISASIDPFFIGDDNNFKKINVTVTGQSKATLTTLVSDY